MDNITLFNELSIEAYLNSIDKKIIKELRSSSSLILSSDPSELANKLAKKYKIDTPVFNYASTTNKIVPTPERIRHEIVLIDYVNYEIGFTGNKDILTCRPKRGVCQIGFPLVVGVTNTNINFYINSQGIVRNEGQPKERVKRYAQSIKDFIECSLNELKSSIDEWNNSLEYLLFEGIKSDKEYLEKRTEAKKALEDDLNTFKNT